MSTLLRFFGVAAYEIITSRGQHILIDPFLDENPGCPVRSKDLDRVDLILVSHAAFGHLGDTEAVARRTGAPVVCGGEVKAYLLAKGVPPEQVRVAFWGTAVEVAGIRVQPVECHHWSQVRLPDGTYASGAPMGFVVHADPGVRFYHHGDTAIFSDLKLIGELYRPTAGCVGIANPKEILYRATGPGRLLTAEMSPREAALAAEWLGLDVAFPCHYIRPDCDEVREFLRALDEARAQGRRVPRAVVLEPGEFHTMEPKAE